MWRLIACILIFAVFLAFIVFNLGNSCDVSLGFVTFSDIPVFLSALISFVLGMFFAVPFVISAGRRRKRKTITDPDSSSPGVVTEESFNPIKLDGSTSHGYFESKSSKESKKTGHKKSWGLKSKKDPKDTGKIERDESFNLADKLMKENDPNGNN